MTSAPVTIPQKFNLSRRPKPPPDASGIAMNGSLTNGTTGSINGTYKRKRSIEEKPPQSDQARKRIKDLKAYILKGEEGLVIVDDLTDGPIVID